MHKRAPRSLSKYCSHTHSLFCPGHVCLQTTTNRQNKVRISHLWNNLTGPLCYTAIDWASLWNTWLPLIILIENTLEKGRPQPLAIIFTSIVKTQKNCNQLGKSAYPQQTQLINYLCPVIALPSIARHRAKVSFCLVQVRRFCGQPSIESM